MNQATATGTVETFEGYLDFDGMRIQVGFQTNVGASAAEKDAAFMAALAQQATVNYLSIGTQEGSLERTDHPSVINLQKLFDLTKALDDSSSQEGCEADLAVVSSAQLWDLVQYVGLLKKASEAAASDA